jgi:hypothetical protein
MTLKCTQDIKKLLKGIKDIKSYLYSKDSLNDDLESKF